MTIYTLPVTRIAPRLAALAAACFAVLLLAQPVAAAQAAAFIKGSAEAGAAKAVACTACHGPNGNSANPEWPRLAGQNAAYLTEQIKLVRDAKRNILLMAGIANALSDQDIADIAAYFSTQTPVGLEANAGTWQAGAKLYRNGDATRGIPACMACHGPGARGNPAAGYPALRAQHGTYTAKQLADYSSLARYTKNDKGQMQGSANSVMMQAIASRLTETDRNSLASYLQGIR
jgi:cytochrome c553